MTSLTRVVEDLKNPVAVWLRETFPHHKPILQQIRTAAGPAKIVPPAGVGLGTQGGAIDWWLRFLIDPTPPPLDTAVWGLSKLAGHPAHAAGMRMFHNLGLPIDDTGEFSASPTVDIGQFDDASQACICYALSLLTELYRAPVASSRLLSISERDFPRELTDLVCGTEITDLIRMRDAAQHRLMPNLPDGPVISGPTFAGSADLPADADLIVGDMLLELKATQGGKPRADGTRAIRIERTDIDQLLGYLLMDYTDCYKLQRVAFYAMRFECFTAWPVDEFLAALAGRSIDVSTARAQFETVLQDHLPAYLTGCPM